mmetsp:Transcript_13987/g.30960  ORF Transcript_13987/g.30960 Transcript_13987/m.30960 type:complete len:481 (+) Transcript_13987:41-1483(+)
MAAAEAVTPPRAVTNSNEHQVPREGTTPFSDAVTRCRTPAAKQSYGCDVEVPWLKCCTADASDRDLWSLAIEHDSTDGGSSASGSASIGSWSATPSSLRRQQRGMATPLSGRSFASKGSSSFATPSSSASSAIGRGWLAGSPKGLRGFEDGLGSLVVTSAGAEAVAPWDPLSVLVNSFQNLTSGTSARRPVSHCPAASQRPVAATPRNGGLEKSGSPQWLASSLQPAVPVGSSVAVDSEVITPPRCFTARSVQDSYAESSADEEWKQVILGDCYVGRVVTLRAGPKSKTPPRLRGSPGLVSPPRVLQTPSKISQSSPSSAGTPQSCSSTSSAQVWTMFVRRYDAESRMHYLVSDGYCEWAGRPFDWWLDLRKMQRLGRVVSVSAECSERLQDEFHYLNELPPRWGEVLRVDEDVDGFDALMQDNCVDRGQNVLNVGWREEEPPDALDVLMPLDSEAAHGVQDISAARPSLNHTSVTTSML